MIKPKVVLLIFVSGKIVLTGAKVDIRSWVFPEFLLLTFPSACKGAGGDIHGIQHDLHHAMQIPQAITTAWFTAHAAHEDGCVTIHHRG